MKTKHQAPQFELPVADQIFNLLVESALDGQRIEREGQEAERRRQEACALAAKQQIEIALL